MTRTKSPLQSLGVVGGAAAALAGVAGLIGWTVTPSDVAEISQQADQVVTGAQAVVDAFIDLVALVGGALAVWGRLRAESKIVLPWDRPAA